MTIADHINSALKKNQNQYHVKSFTDATNLLIDYNAAILKFGNKPVLRSTLQCFIKGCASQGLVHK
jgi:hypothetical protein